MQLARLRQLPRIQSRMAKPKLPVICDYVTVQCPFLSLSFLPVYVLQLTRCFGSSSASHPRLGAPTTVFPTRFAILQPFTFPKLKGINSQPLLIYQLVSQQPYIRRTIVNMPLARSTDPLVWIDCEVRIHLHQLHGRILHTIQEHD